MKALVYENAQAFHFYGIEEMGAELVIDHSKDVTAQLNATGIDQVDMVFSTAGTAKNLSWIAKLLRPFGHLPAVDFAPPFDASPIVLKSISLDTEMVFAKVISGFDLVSQSKILAEIANRVVSGGCARSFRPGSMA